MNAVRRILFFVAFVVAMKAMFGDVNALIQMWAPLAELPAVAREAALHVPYALIAALLLTRAEVWGRLPAMVSLYPPLVIAAAALVMAAGIARTNPDLAILAARLVTLVLVVPIVMILTRLTPKPGFIYEGSSFPAVKAFLALTLLAALSVPLAMPILAVTGAGGVADRVPAAYLDLAVAAVVVAAFIVASGVRFRSLQPNSASTWMTLGILAWVVAQLVEPAEPLLRTYGLHKQTLVATFIAHAPAIRGGLQIFAHALLFVGCFTLLSHLLPERERIARM
jgi:hypothetical protein